MSATKDPSRVEDPEEQRRVKNRIPYGGDTSIPRDN